MALFKIFKGNSSDLGKNGTPTQKATEGFAYFTTDEGKFYIDISGDGTTNAVVGTNRIALNADKADRADNFNIAGTLNVVGNTSLHNQSTIDNATIGTLTVTGAANFVQSPTALTPMAGDSSTKLATTEFVSNAISSGFAANDAMVFKGTIGNTSSPTNASIASLPTNGYSAGWTYRVVTSGSYVDGTYCEIGDLIIAVNDGPSTGSTVIAGDWTIAQTNIEGLGSNAYTNYVINAKSSGQNKPIAYYSGENEISPALYAHFSLTEDTGKGAETLVLGDQNNRYGRIALYDKTSNSGGVAYITPNQSTDYRFHTLPDADGWLATGPLAGAGSTTEPVYLDSNGILQSTDSLQTKEIYYYTSSDPDVTQYIYVKTNIQIPSSSSTDIYKNILGTLRMGDYAPSSQLSTLSTYIIPVSFYYRYVTTSGDSPITNSVISGAYTDINDSNSAIKGISMLIVRESDNQNYIYFKITRKARYTTFNIFCNQYSSPRINCAVSASVTAPESIQRETDLNKIKVVDDVYKTRLVGTKSLSAEGWYRILDCTRYSSSFLITFYGLYTNKKPSPVTFLVSHSYNNTSISQIGRSSFVGWITKLRAVHYDTSKFYIDVYFAGNAANNVFYEITPLDNISRNSISQIDYTLITDEITADAECTHSENARADQLYTARQINGTNFDGTANITTAKWGTSRNISISDSDATNTSSTVSADGSADVVLKLPATIKATLSGNAATADKVNHSITIGSYVFDGSDNVNIPIYNGETIA